jgi:hypothetical protein
MTLNDCTPENILSADRVIANLQRAELDNKDAAHAAVLAAAVAETEELAHKVARLEGRLAVESKTNEYLTAQWSAALERLVELGDLERIVDVQKAGRG